METVRNVTHCYISTVRNVTLLQVMLHCYGNSKEYYTLLQKYSKECYIVTSNVRLLWKQLGMLHIVTD